MLESVTATALVVKFFFLLNFMLENVYFSALILITRCPWRRGACKRIYEM